MSQVHKWKCGVCSFANIAEAQACALCETKPGMVVSDEAVGAAYLHPNDLTPLQHSARYYKLFLQVCIYICCYGHHRMRKQWLRTVDDASGQIVWSQLTQPFGPNQSKSDDTYFIVTSTLPTVPEANIYADVGDQSIHVVVDDEPPPSTPSTKPTDGLEPLLASRMSLEATAQVPSSSPDQQVRVELSFEPLTMASAQRTLVATTLSPWLVRQLDDLTNESFSVKYLALLSLLRANMDYGYTLFTQAVFEPSAGLFVATDSYGYTLNPSSTCRSDLEKFRAVGRLLARSILDEQVLPFHLTVPLFKMILGTPLSMTDMLYMDKQMYTSLKFVQSTMDVDGLCLDFSVAVEGGNVVELVPHGQNIMVTAANQAEYVQRMLQYLLFDRIQVQLQSLLTGLFEVHMMIYRIHILPQQYLIMFDHKELELVLCGVTEIDVVDWKQFTATSTTLGPGGAHAMQMDWFWEVVAELTFRDRAKLLQFATGSTRVPVQGFKGLTSYDGLLCPFSVKAIPYRRGILPRAHACFNRIDLPLYPTKDLMEQGLLALVHLEMSDFTMV
ncbi:hypothetical protein DYB31_004296 [Aphanomyces astaci]|uniref:HECT-type E3 ubiquitin transferase n=1 Tax=Aphanomyces astaci TaxID=112090 RepID=A0A397F4P0_APHAT|nr:hypothetical protein DYB31_004296 [Aphanomyces astaci]